MNRSEQVTQFHNQAMDIVETAYFAQRKGDNVIANQQFKAAYELEKQAAMLLIEAYDIEPTRSILFKGAAQLAFNFGDLRAMEQMIGFALTGNPNPQIAYELRQLLLESELETSNISISKGIFKYKTLSSELQKEVDDFVDFLVQKYGKTA